MEDDVGVAIVSNHYVLVAAARPDWKSAAVVGEKLADWLVADVDLAGFDGG